MFENRSTRNHANRSLLLLALVTILALALVACGGEPPAPTTAAQEPTEEPAVEEPTEEPEEPTEEPMEEPTEEPAEEAITPSVTVEDQELGADNTVVIANVTAADPGWMVIHADDGGPGPVIGFAPVEVGENEDVTVEVDPEMATETLYAMLHIDAGTEGEYEFPGDDGPVMDADGNVITPPFTVQLPEAAGAEPSVTTEDQSLGEENTVTVPLVVAAEAGWIVIHTDQDGGPGPVIGQAAVEAGENADVEVTIAAAGATETLHAMLHSDTGEAGVYEFPDADPPVQDGDGNVVMEPFAVDGLPENAVSVRDQPLGEGNTVTVPAVKSEVAGWMVIHADDSGPGPVIGFAPVEAGINRDVSVELDAEGVTDTLYAMLHIDAGVEGEYEFPGEDGPAMDADGNVVVLPFAITAAEEMDESGDEAESGDVVVISMLDSSFDPAELSIPVGTTVRWVNDGELPHTATADDDSFDSGTLQPGESFEFTFDTAGDYPYYCLLHGGPGGVGMAATLTVTE
jgi:plastocyanin